VALTMTSICEMPRLPAPTATVSPRLIGKRAPANRRAHTGGNIGKALAVKIRLTRYILGRGMAGVFSRKLGLDELARLRENRSTAPRAPVSERRSPCPSPCAFEPRWIESRAEDEGVELRGIEPAREVLFKQGRISVSLAATRSGRPPF